MAMITHTKGRQIVCACGAERETNVNGAHIERGTWQETRVVVSRG